MKPLGRCCGLYVLLSLEVPMLRKRVPLGGSSDNLGVLYQSSRSPRAAVGIDTQWQTSKYVIRLWLMIYARITNLAVHSSPFSTPSRAPRMAAFGGERYQATANCNVAEFNVYMGQPKVFVWRMSYSSSLGTVLPV